MIFQGSSLYTCDNSGAKEVKCIKIFKNKKKGSVGDTIKVSVSKLKKYKKNSTSKLKKKALSFAIIAQVNKKILNKSGHFFVYYSKNAVLLLNERNKLLGTRNYGKLSVRLRENKQLKSLSLNIRYL